MSEETPRHTALPQSRAEALDLPTPWLLTDYAGIIREVNPAAVVLLGGLPAFVLGKPLVVFFSPDQFTPLLRYLVAARRADQQWTLRLVPWRRHPLDVRLTAGPVWRDAHNRGELAWTLEPLDEAAPSPPSAAVAAVAPPPNSDAAAAGLAPPPHSVMTADDETLRRVFLSAMTHELLTPLTIIQGHAETLRYPAVRANQAQVDQALEAIGDETVRLRRLVQNVIDAARASAGDLPITLAPASLAPLVARVVQRFAGRSRRHHFSAKVPTTLPTVLADLERLESVLYNLLDNALKYSPRGGEIHVEAIARTAEIEVYVADEGIGVPVEEEANVFAPYYRADPQGRIQGSGLGLYLARVVVDAHGGRIWLTGRPSGGTAVHFTLPLA